MIDQTALRERVQERDAEAFSEDGSFVFGRDCLQTEDCPVRYDRWCALQEGPAQTTCDGCEIAECVGQGPPCRRFWECEYVDEKADCGVCGLLLEWYGALLEEAGVHVPGPDELTRGGASDAH